ncbi:MAG: hypothetical protein LBH43_04420 [Treponema sp.]|nr:hypothetical protein [Treponema sp.]
MTGADILDGDLVLICYTDMPRDGALQAVRYRDQVTLKRLGTALHGRQREGGYLRH